MDWFSWLSKTSLDPSLAHEYGLAFSHNELEEDDIPYLNHEFLQSMGISIAKHRLEILKLARRERRTNNPYPPMSRLMVAIRRTKRSLLEYIRTLVRRDESALVLVSKRSYSSRWRGAMLKRNSRRSQVSNMGKQERLLLTNGNIPLEIAGSRIDSSSVAYDVRSYDKIDSYDDPYWPGTPVEEIRWDAMFQDLKPT